MMKGYLNETGFQPIHCLRRAAEEPRMMLVVLRAQRTETDGTGAFVSESTEYKNAAGRYLGDGKWDLFEAGGAIFTDNKSETLSCLADGNLVRETREIAAWCEIPEEIVRRRHPGNTGAPAKLPVTA